MMKNGTVSLFYSYCHADEEHRDCMEKFLTVLSKDGLLTEWHDRKIIPGNDLEKSIEQALLSSDIVVFLVSADFLGSDACRKEWFMAKKMRENSNKRIVSVIVRECPWLDFDTMSETLALPKDGFPLSKWSDKDAYWNGVYKGIKNLIEDIRETFLLKPEFEKNITSVEFCSQADDEISLHDIFVFPELVHYKNRDDVDILRSITGVDDICKEEYVIIKGDHQSGKTKLCSYMFIDLYKKNLNVLLVDANDVAHKKPTEDVYKSIFEEQFSGDYEMWLKNNKKILIMDNVSHDKKSIDHLLFCESIFEKIIFTVSSDDYDAYFKDEQRLSKYEIVSIRPLTHVKQEKLIQKWLKARRSGVGDDVIHSEIDKIESNINTIVIDNKILPRYPFFILSILQTTETFMPKDVKITAYGHCYYALILAHLIKSGIDKQDDSITACFNYLEQFAFYMYSENRDNSGISLSQCEQFKSDYKSKFIIKDALINRMHGRYGLIKEEKGTLKFNLPYGYYFFLGQYLSSNYKSHRDSIVDMIEHSYIRSNALTIIFAIHHAKDHELIDEILTHTVCAIENIKPAELNEKETAIFKGLLKEVPVRILEDESVDKTRREEREFRDKQDGAGNRSYESEVRIQKEFFRQVYQCRKNIDILSHVIKNKYGSMRISQLKDVVEIVCEAGLRLAGLWLFNEDEFEELVGYVEKQYRESDKYDRAIPEREQLDMIRRTVTFRVFLWVISNIESIVTSINKPELSPIVKEIVDQKNTPAYEVIKYFYTLDTIDSLSESERLSLKEMTEKYDKSKMFFLHKILAIRTHYYLSTHSVPAKVAQSVCALLGIKYSPASVKNLTKG